MINILGQIGKERHTFLKLIIPTLKQIQQETLKAFTGSHISSIQHAIKSALILFMKNKIPSQSVQEILTIFEKLGVSEVGTKLRHKYYPHMKRSASEPSDPRALAKKFKDEREEAADQQPVSSNMTAPGEKYTFLSCHQTKHHLMFSIKPNLAFLFLIVLNFLF